MASKKRLPPMRYRVIVRFSDGTEVIVHDDTHAVDLMKNVRDAKAYRYAFIGEAKFDKVAPTKGPGK